jgi:enamine deaminase RidA (YjgF/YER057c/UK114 family)
MMSFEENLKTAGIVLPPAPKPVGNYIPAVRAGNLIFTSGQLPIANGTLLHSGKVPDPVSLESAQASARQACLNALAAVRGLTGSLDQIVRIVRLNVFVHSSPSFAEQAKVANAASEVLHQVFGHAGTHTRCAIGAAELPLNAPVELDLVVQVK